MEKCWQCGSSPDNIEYDGVCEMFGIESQSGYIQCSGQNKKYCPVEVRISFDCVTGVAQRIEPVLIEAWNTLNRKEDTNDDQ